MNEVGRRSRSTRQVRRPVILVVEDDVLIRLNAVEVLQNAGYWTLESANADAAIDILESQPEIAAVFTDIEMPGSMNGIGLAFVTRTNFLKIKILVTSGRRSAEDLQLPQGARFISKPHSDREIVDTISEMLGTTVPEVSGVEWGYDSSSRADDPAPANSGLFASVKEDDL